MTSMTAAVAEAAGATPAPAPAADAVADVVATSSWKVSAAVAALYVVLTALVLWPLPAAPWRLGVPNEDNYGNIWTLAWVVRQAVRDPLHLFDANIFYPNPQTLAYTESLLPLALQAAPVLLLGGSPLLAHNVVLFLTFPLAAFAAFLLARELSGSVASAVLAGLAYGFACFRWGHLVHVHTLSVQWLPLVILFARRAATRGHRMDWLLLSLTFVLQALTNGYYAVLTAIILGLTLVWYARDIVQHRRWRPLVATLLFCVAIPLLVFVPYRATMVRESRLRGYQLARSRDDMVQWSASWSSYLNPGPFVGAPHLRLLERRFGGATEFYPTLPVIALSAVALLRRPRHEAVRLMALFTATGVLLSLGPQVQVGSVALPGPLEVLRRLPGFTMLRTPDRFGILATLGLSMLAAMGWAQLVRGGHRFRLATLGLGAVIFLELFPVGLERLIRPIPDPPPTADWLARAKPGPILELPWDHETMGYGGLYAYWSTRHWQPLVNGWGGFYPRDSFKLGVLGKQFPNEFSARRFRRVGIRYVVVHRDLIPANLWWRRAQAATTHPLPEGVQLVAEFGPHRIYEIDPGGPLPKSSDTNERDEP